MKPLVGELRKLLRPLMMWALIATAVGTAAMTSLYLSGAQRQYQIGLSNLDFALHPPADFCAAEHVAVGNRCEARKVAQLEEARAFLDEISEMYPLAGVMESPLGAAGVGAGFAASLLGFLALAALAGGHVAGEWSGQTIKRIVARDPRRVRLLAAKFASLWVAGVALILAGWLGLLVLGPVFRRVYKVPPAPPGFSAWNYSSSSVARALAVMAIFAALGLLVAVLTRNPLGTFGIMFGFCFLSFALAVDRATVLFSPAFWIGDWMRIVPNNMADHLWVERFPMAGAPVHLSSVMGVTVLFAFALACLAASAGIIRSRDIGG